MSDVQRYHPQIEALFNEAQHRLVTTVMETDDMAILSQEEFDRIHDGLKDKTISYPHGSIERPEGKKDVVLMKLATYVEMIEASDAPTVIRAEHIRAKFYV